MLTPAAEAFRAKSRAFFANLPPTTARSTAKLACLDTRTGTLRRYLYGDNGRIKCDANIVIGEFDKVASGAEFLDEAALEAFRTDPTPYIPLETPQEGNVA